MSADWSPQETFLTEGVRDQPHMIVMYATGAPVRYDGLAARGIHPAFGRAVWAWLVHPQMLRISLLDAASDAP